MKLPILIFFLQIVIYGQSRSQTISNTDLVLDHIFIWTGDQNQIQSLLKANGFKIYVGKEHSGQGTTGNYLFFFNVYLEFISVSNINDFNSNTKNNNLHGMQLKEEWKKNGVSPFGIGLHLKDSALSKINFNTFNYTQAWMEPGTYLKVSRSLNSHQREPMVFVVPEYLKMNQIVSSDNANEFQIHLNKLRKLTSAEITCNHCSSFSEAIVELNTIRNLKIKKGEEDLLELIFDFNQQNRKIDLRPQLPVILKY